LSLAWVISSHVAIGVTPNLCLTPRLNPCRQISTCSFCGRPPLVRPAVRRNLSMYSLIGSPSFCFIEARVTEDTSTSQSGKRCRNFHSRSFQDLMHPGLRHSNH